MRIDVPVRRRSFVSLTSLIDVIFLLLLFFMLTSVFMRFSSMEIAETAPVGAAGGVPGLLVRIEGSDGVRLNGEVTALADLPTKLAAFSERGVESAIVSVGSQADTQSLVDVMELIKASPIQSVTLRR